VITFFTIPKPFNGFIELIQKNAIISWTKLHPNCEIILFGDEKGTAEISKELEILHVPTIELNKYGTPIISDVFQKAQNLASNENLCYVNSDIIFLNDFIESALITIQFDRFLMIGQRWDINFNEKILFEKGWENSIKKIVNTTGTLHPPSGMDYFLFRKGDIANIPSFIVGRPYWDQWMIGNALKNQFRVIDATSCIMAIHQNHDYNHVIESTGKKWEGPEADYNISLLKNDFNLGNIYNSNWILTNGKLKRAPFIRQLKWNIYSKLIKIKHQVF
jgi:hypothetical protein